MRKSYEEAVMLVGKVKNCGSIPSDIAMSYACEGQPDCDMCSGTGHIVC